MAESERHRQLKHVASRWLWERGYAAIAEEVTVPGVGIIDVVAAGTWKRRNPRRPSFDREPIVERHHVLFVECKAMRADFLRDQGRQHQFSFALGERRHGLHSGRSRRPRHASAALGKFDTCLVRPHANQHYLLTPPRMIRSNEIPRRWGWLTFDGVSIRVMRKAAWQEVADVGAIEGAIARSLTLARMGSRQLIVRPAMEEKDCAGSNGVIRRVASLDYKVAIGGVHFQSNDSPESPSSPVIGKPVQDKDGRVDGRLARQGISTSVERADVMTPQGPRVWTDRKAGHSS